MQALMILGMRRRAERALSYFEHCTAQQDIVNLTGASKTSKKTNNVYWMIYCATIPQNTL